MAPRTESDPSVAPRTLVPSATDIDDATERPTRITTGGVFKRTLTAFGADGCTDLASALTYFAVQALFPALLAIVSVLGLFGQAKNTTDQVLDLIQRFASAEVVDAIRGPVEQLTQSSAAGITFVVGILGAIWSASGYVGAFGRAMNRIYDRTEGRPIWKLRPTNLLVTVVAVVLVALAGLILVLSGGIARTIGGFVGLGDFALDIWSIAKWPVLAVIVVVVVAVLYHFAPNVRRRFRILSLGALLAIGIWVVASAGFGFYVANFANYNKTYGALGGVIIFLLWLWITNNALLFGAEFDAERERAKELERGIAAEEEVQLPPRDTRQSDKKAEKHEAEVEVSVEVREAAEERQELAAADADLAREREAARKRTPADDPADFV